MARLFHLLIYSLFMVALLSCNRPEDKAIALRLSQWDIVLDEDPGAIKDSLALLNTKELFRDNRAYYGLLKTIVDDKTFTHFTSDSLINTVLHYYQGNKSGSDEHIRALVYQGVVRYRMEMADSAVSLP